MLEDSLDAEMQELAREELRELRARREEQIDERLQARADAQRTPTTRKNIDRGDSRRRQAATRQACSPPSCSACTPATPSVHRWQVELLNTNEKRLGGFKEVIFEVHGRGAYSRMKFESGVHRVQRVPATEAQGRIHTSTATVVVLPEVEEVEVEIDEERPAHRRVSLQRARRAERQHDRLGGAHHAPAHRAWS